MYLKKRRVDIQEGRARVGGREQVGTHGWGARTYVWAYTGREGANGWVQMGGRTYVRDTYRWVHTGGGREHDFGFGASFLLNDGFFVQIGP
jgi:hypothetical protein